MRCRPYNERHLHFTLVAVSTGEGLSELRYTPLFSKLLGVSMDKNIGGVHNSEKCNLDLIKDVLGLKANLEQV